MTADEYKRQLIKAVADRGQAAGLEAAAHILMEMAAAHTRVVGTNTIKDAAQAMRDKAAAMRQVADNRIRIIETYQ